MSATELSNPTAHLRWFDKLLVIAALGIAVALFLSIGWLAIAPADPYGATSLVTHRQPIVLIIQVTLLAGVTATVATVIIGTKLPDVGVFATALGMALVSQKGATAAYLLVTVAQGNRSRERVLAVELAGEAIVWFLVLVVAMIISALVLRWCYGTSRRIEGGQVTPRGVTVDDMSAAEIPGLSRSLATGARTESPLIALRYAGGTAVIGLAIFALLISGSAPRSILHGQAFFATFAAFYIATWIMKSTFGARTPLWGLLAVVAVCVIGFIWTIFVSGAAVPYAHLANIPPSRFLRALPLTFVSVGALGALLAHWTVADPAPKTPEPQPPRKRSRR